MKTVLCLFIFCVVIAALNSVEAIPAPHAPPAPSEGGVEANGDVSVEEDLRADRHRRVTCDLLSFSTPWGSLNNSACAANCLRMGKGYRGGSCRDGVCHCRK